VFTCTDAIRTLLALTRLALTRSAARHETCVREEALLHMQLV
jgi:hypothetical protein